MAGKKRKCNCGTGRYCHTHRQYALSIKARKGYIGLIQYDDINLYRCGGGRRIVRKTLLSY